jgi:hypothetical protein
MKNAPETIKGLLQALQDSEEGLIFVARDVGSIREYDTEIERTFVHFSKDEISSLKQAQDFLEKSPALHVALDSNIENFCDHGKLRDETIKVYGSGHYSFSFTNDWTGNIFHFSAYDLVEISPEQHAVLSDTEVLLEDVIGTIDEPKQKNASKPSMGM